MPTIKPLDVAPRTTPRSAREAAVACILPASLPREERFHNFDYLRLFLALEVVVSHLYAGLTMGRDLWLPVPPVAAFVGLSGFLIPQSLERSRSLGHFAWKRALRTLPALVPLLIAIALVYGLDHVGRTIVQYLTAGYRSKFQGVTLPLWSLSVEDGLYACAALLFALGSHRSLKVTGGILLALLVVQSKIADPMVRYRFFDTSIAFFAGNLVYILNSHLKRVPWFWSTFAFVACAAGALGFAGSLQQPLLIGCLIVAAMTAPQFKRDIPDLSYAIYIWHAPILLALLSPFGMGRNASWVVATCALTFVVAVLSWHLVEKPALRYKNWRAAGPSPVPATQSTMHSQHKSDGRGATRPMLAFRAQEPL